MLHGEGALTYTSSGKYTGEFRDSLAYGFGLEVFLMEASEEGCGKPDSLRKALQPQAEEGKPVIQGADEQSNNKEGCFLR
jgi:hypothetical protein